MKSWIERFFERVGGLGAQSAIEPSGDPQRLAAIADVLRSIAPMVAADGGHIELLGTTAGLVYVELRGACAGCSASDMTLDGVLEPRLREALPWFTGLRVESVADFRARQTRAAESDQE